MIGFASEISGMYCGILPGILNEIDFAKLSDFADAYVSFLFVNEPPAMCLIVGSFSDKIIEIEIKTFSIGQMLIKMFF